MDDEFDSALCDLRNVQAGRYCVLTFSQESKMHLQFVRTHKSLRDFPATGEIPNFIVLTGENGAGKSQVLEAIRDLAIIGDWPQRHGAVRMMTTPELAIGGDLQGANETRDALVDRFEQQVRQMLTNGMTYPSPEMVPNLHARLVGENVLSETTIARIERESGRPIAEWSRRDYVDFTPVEVGFTDPFALAVGDLFSRYRQMLTLNGYNRWRSSEFGETVHWLADNDFEVANGPAPWDLLNSALRTVSLKYQFEVPEASLSPTMSPPRLRDVGTSQEIGAGSLSSGEKTLLMIAMSLYSVVHRRDAIAMPEILLLDEPDATLHPSMIKSLLALLQDEFVAKHGVRVIVTTHSPTTVALAPEDSLFTMDRDSHPRFSRAHSKDAALSRLLVGVPTLSVSHEHRRVVVVESANDERLYTSIQSVIGPRLGSERSLAFMPAGGNGLPDGCDAVVGLVRTLRNRGNVSVWGLVDRDDRQSDPHDFVYLDPTRYAIENGILDPLALGLLHLSEAHPDVLAQSAPVDFLSFVPADHAQLLVDIVVDAVAQNGDDLSGVPVHYADGTMVTVPAFWLEMRGHDLEETRILVAYPGLRVHRGLLMDRIVERVWRSRPGCIPRATVDLFARLLA